jgi:hypothetical protein
MTTASAAITESIQTDSIVTLNLDSAECLTRVMNELLAECDDCVEYPVLRGLITEYWGVDDDGSTWRVHVQTTETFDDGYDD